MSRLRIAVDIDDVLSKHVEDFLSYCNDTWGMTLTVEDYSEDWPNLWNLDRQEAELRARKIFSPEVMGQYRYIHAARAVLESLAINHTLIVITSRRVETRELTEQWIDTYFPDIFESIHMAGLWDEMSTAAAINLTKADICESLAIDVLIDDQLKHCIGVAERGIAAIVYGDYHWNKSDSLPEMVTRCESWQEIAEYFAGIASPELQTEELVDGYA